MKKNLMFAAGVLAAQFATSAVMAQASTDLLLSEVRIAAPGETTVATTEYFEIFNPTASAISLDNYFVTDRQNYFQAAKHFYDCEQDPTCTDPGLFATTGDTDFLFRFPQGFSIPSGGVVVVTTDVANFLTVHFGAGATSADYYNQPGNPQLFTTRTDETYFQPDNSTPVPAMLQYGSSNQLNMTNGGEWAALIYIDGTSELVQDVDIVAWNNPSGGNTFPDKGFLTVGSSTYAEEFGGGNPVVGNPGNLLVRPSSGNYGVIRRVTTIEVGQIAGGNGRTGQDETMEDVSVTWVGFTDASVNSHPGVTDLIVGETALPPQITSPTRNTEFPGAATTITLSATITDLNGTVTAANALVDSGSGFTSVPMTNTGGNNWAAEVGPFADNTVVRWYVEASNNFGESASNPITGEAGAFIFHVQNTPIGKGDIVINEISYNPQGADAGGAEFVELYNNTSQVVDLSGFNFSRDSDNANFTIPFGTTIEPDGFLVLAQNIPAMNTLYGEGTIDPMIQWGTWQLLNGGVGIRLKHANVMGFSDQEFTIVSYSQCPPWPIITSAECDPVGPTGDGDGRTIELIDPSLDESNPANWRASTAPTGTPGQVNVSSDVNDWMLH